MSAKYPWRRCLGLSVAIFCLAACAGRTPAQTKGQEIWEPTPGQQGKDVIWVPSEQALVDKMLGLAKVTPDDYVVDLGSGDGRIVITAAKLGAHALGIEYDSNLVAVSKQNAEHAGVADRARFVQGDILKEDFSRATVVTMFLLTSLNLQLREKILDMKPGTRIVSNTFDMASWLPDHTIDLTHEEGCDGYYCHILLWIVPAKVGGLWRLPQGELKLRQTFQTLRGTLSNGNGVTPIVDGRIEGNRVSFRIGDDNYNGEIIGKTLQGSVTGSQDSQWVAQGGGSLGRSRQRKHQT